MRIFYGAVSPTWRALLDASAGASLLSKTPEEANIIIESMASNRSPWMDNRPKSPTRRVLAIKDHVEDKIEEINKQIAELKLNQGKSMEQGQASQPQQQAQTNAIPTNQQM